MYHVVIGLDEDESHARLCAEEVLRLPGEPAAKRVTLVHGGVDRPSSGPVTEFAPVRAASEALADAGVACDVTGASGDPAEAIIDAAAAADADLIVVGGRKRSPAGKALFGSVTQTVVLNAKRPVMVTGTPGET
jgi:nucleotide-binding universal stress UspA family protein